MCSLYRTHWFTVIFVGIGIIPFITVRQNTLSPKQSNTMSSFHFYHSYQLSHIGRYDRPLQQCGSFGCVSHRWEVSVLNIPQLFVFSWAWCYLAPCCSHCTVDITGHQQSQLQNLPRERVVACINYL